MVTVEDLGVGARGGCLSWPTESRCCCRKEKERGKGSQPYSNTDSVSQKPLIEGKRPVFLESLGEELCSHANDEGFIFFGMGLPRVGCEDMASAIEEELEGNIGPGVG